MQNIAIFASGEGTNAENIVRYFQKKKSVQVAVIIYNRKDAGVRLRAERCGVPSVFMNKSEISDEQQMMEVLKSYRIDFIVLSGFLLLIPHFLIEHFANKIVNIHPSLIPLHCGKGMYGIRVHEDVIAQGDHETGITIHLINEHYDQGQIVFQAKCSVYPEDSAEDVAQRVHQLEYEHYPAVIEQLILKQSNEGAS